MGGVKKGHIRITTSNVNGAGIYKGGSVLVFEKIAILLSGNIFFIDILNGTTHTYDDYVRTQ